MSDWLELELAERLAPEKAPDELWRRVAQGPRRRSNPLAMAAPIAAVLALVVAGAIWFMARGPQPSPTFRQFPASARAEACTLCHTTL